MNKSLTATLSKPMKTHSTIKSFRAKRNRLFLSSSSFFFFFFFLSFFEGGWGGGGGGGGVGRGFVAKCLNYGRMAKRKAKKAEGGRVASKNMIDDVARNSLIDDVARNAMTDDVARYT